MKFKQWIFWGLSLALLISCSDQSVQTPADRELQSADEARAFFSEMRGQSNLITEIEPPIGKGRLYRFYFEDGTIASLPRLLLSSYDVEAESWQVRLSFRGSSSTFSAAMVGTSLPVSIERNPHDLAPLTALASAEMPVAGRFRVRVLGRGDDGIAIGHEFQEPGGSWTSGSKTHFEMPVLGLYAGHNNQVEFTFMSPSGNERLADTLSIQTNPIPINPQGNIVANGLPEDEDELYFIADLKAGFDQRGEVRWIYTGEAQYIFRKMRNGNLLMDSSEDLVSYHSKSFMEVTVFGKTVREYEVPNRIHHEVRQLPWENFLVASNANRFEGNGNDGLTEEGVIIEIDHQSGQVVKEWDFNQILDTTRRRPPGGNPDDLLHINTVYYDETDNSIVISSKHQSTIAKVDYDSGDIIWLLAHPDDWGERWQPYVLEPVTADGSPVDLSSTDFYSYFQHAPMRLPDGNILLYDNGNYRNFYNGAVDHNYSRAVEYKIDKEAGTVQLVWEFDYNHELFTAATGDVDLLPNGNRLISFLWGGNKTPKIVELDTQGNIVFDMEVDVGEGNYYRAEKIDLYSTRLWQ